MTQLSTMQRKIYDYIVTCVREQGYPPSVREIGDAVGLSSTSSVQYNLNKLERMGCIERDPNCKRTIRLPGRAAQVAQVPLLGTVTAGVPILATQHIEEYIPVFGARPGEELFALHVRGDSMIGAHIEDGDIVVVERTPVAENGQIATQYVDLDNKPTMDVAYNPNGSFCAIEAITSPDGRVLGKMGHTERYSPFVGKNIYGEKYQPLFANGVKYFK